MKRFALFLTLAIALTQVQAFSAATKKPAKKPEMIGKLF